MFPPDVLCLQPDEPGAGVRGGIRNQQVPPLCLLRCAPVGMTRVFELNARFCQAPFPQASTNPSSTAQDVHRHTGFGTCAKRAGECKV